AVELGECPEVSRPPRQSLCLLCKASSFSFCQTHMQWVQEVPRKGLEWVAENWSNGVTRYGPWVQGSCSISRDNSQSMVTLQFSSLRGNDSACLT
ncbi:HV03 protein, partial [Alcedo cyanopectus]|nr:HV03 protein [Ceyx cyanopectus]